jgi:hypothetical protein
MRKNDEEKALALIREHEDKLYSFCDARQLLSTRISAATASLPFFNFTVLLGGRRRHRTPAALTRV